MSIKSIRTEVIILPKGDIQDGVLRDFHKIHSGAFEVYLILCAYSSDSSGIAKVGVRTIMKSTGFGFKKILDCLDELKKVDLITIPMRNLPFEERIGKSFIYEIRKR